MENIKETFLKKYGIWEYILFLIGLAFSGRVVYSFVIADFKTLTLEEIGIMILFLCLGILAFAAPLKLLEFARKRVGMETREEKLKK